MPRCRGRQTSFLHATVHSSCRGRCEGGRDPVQSWHARVSEAGAPLVVPHEAAELVTADPASWVDVVKGFRGDIETGGFEDGLTHDVQELIWRAVLLEPIDQMPENSELATFLARRVLALARRCVSREWEPQHGEIDPWSCLRAAFLDISVVARLRNVATAEDVVTLQRLAEVLAAPAGLICRHLASELCAAA
jgi:hypothetical protein